MKLISIIAKGISIAVMVVIIVILTALKSNTGLSDWYTKSFGNFYNNWMGGITNNISFSLFELLVAIAILLIIYTIVMLIIKLIKFKWISAINQAVSVVCLVVFVSLYYTITGSVAYGRSELPIDINTEKVSSQEIKQMSEYHLKLFNEVSKKVTRDDNGLVINPYSNDELSEIINKEFDKIEGDYFIDYQPKVKNAFFSWFMSQMHITGNFFAPTVEISINKDIPIAEAAFCYAHEIAHAKGVAREDDANLIAAYVTLNSDDPFLQYSAYFEVFSSIKELLSITDYNYYTDFSSRIDSAITKEWENSNSFWSHNKFLNDVGSFFNNVYLNLQGQSEGTSAYVDNMNVSIDENNLDENGNPEITINEYSNYQKLLIKNYKNR